MSEAVPGQPFLVGNVMIDVLRRHLDSAHRHSVRDTLGLVPGEYLVSTFLRSSNVDSIAGIERLLNTDTLIFERLPLVLPLRPRTGKALVRYGYRDRYENIPGLKLVDPLGYLAYVDLVQHARAVITDSGTRYASE